MPRFEGVAVEPRFSGTPLESQDNNDFSVTETISNIPSSTGQFVMDTIQPILNPIDTVKHLGNLVAGLNKKTVDSAMKNDGPISTINQMGLAMNPIAAFAEYLRQSTGGEDKAVYVDAVTKYADDRYGGADNFLKTLQEDPVGVIADASMILTGAGATSRIPTLTKAGKYIDPINTAVNAVRVAGKAIPKQLPRSMYESAAKIRPSIQESNRTEMVDTALSERAMPTTAGLDKVSKKIDSLSNDVAKLIKSAEDSGAKISVDELLVNTMDLKQTLSGPHNVNAVGDAATVNRIVEKWLSSPSMKGKDYITPTEAQALKRDLYEKINWNAKRQTGTPAKEKTLKSIAKGAKEEVGKLSPEIDKINQELGKLLELKPELERSANRIDNLNLLGLDTGLKVGAGSAAGGTAGTLVGALAALMEMPRLKAQAAIILESARKTRTLSPDELSTLHTLLRQAVMQEGRQQED